MKVFSYRKLKAWQKARKLSVLTYNITKSFPDGEKFGLISQITSCALTISSIISKKDKVRFTKIPFSSSLELLNQSILSNDLEFLSDEIYKEIRIELSEIAVMLDGLYKSQIISKTIELKNTSTHKLFSS